MLFCVGSPGAVLGTARTSFNLGKLSTLPLFNPCPRVLSSLLRTKGLAGSSAFHDCLDERK